jgi:DNA repair exonuclease SbcCD ATPase subunit/DNA repair exonuclease SbcCD nuclease subunit
MKVLQNIDLSITHIVHLADVHIRNTKRHPEYEAVFEKLYVSIKEEKEQHPGLAIYLGGDIVHAKLDMSPELIQVTYKFLKACADIAPTFMILGNHDCNLNNKNRLDALTPIVNSLNHPNLYFLRDTGIYRTRTLDFVVWSITDDIENYKVPKKSKNEQVLFFHGAIDTAQTEQGIEIRNNKITLSMLNGFDYVLLGDIHKYQYLDENKRICYCGSTVQQNFGESLSHGYVLWYMKTGFSKFVEIPNDHGYYTLEVKNGKFVELPTHFVKKPTIRIKAYDTAQADITKLVTSLKTKVKIEEVKVTKMTSKADTSVINKIKVGDVRDVEYQNNLILNFIEKTNALDQHTKDGICNINRQLNTNIDISKSIKNITWVPIHFEFSNMFSYGEGNKIDFKNMNGIYGLFANNAAGKSSVLDALTFCIFDKCSRTFKAAQVLNNKKDAFTCKFVFEIHGKRYFIERIGIKDKKGHVKVDVKFYTFDKNAEIDLSGQDRDDTNNIIREYLGNYDEFILTTLSLQNNNSNFVDKAQRERKDLLSQFLDLNVFEELTQLATTEANQIKGLIKDYIKQDFSTQIADGLANKKIYTEQAKSVLKQKEEILKQLEIADEKIIQHTIELHPIDEHIISLNIDTLNKETADLTGKLNTCKLKKEEINQRRDSIENAINSMRISINNTDETRLRLNKETKEKYDTKINDLNLKIEKINIIEANLQSKIDKLDTHEYNPNCKHCVNNEFVQDAFKAKDELDLLLAKKTEVYNELESLKSESMAYKNALNEYEQYTISKTEYLTLNNNLMECDNKLKEIDLLENKIEIALSQLKEKHSKYIQNEKAITHNIEITKLIDQYTNKKQQLNLQLSSIENELSNANSQIKIHENSIKLGKDGILKLEKLEEQFKIYDLYIKATNRNGVPYDLISNILPQIENEVNDILSYLADFRIALESDGKSINIYIIYDNDKFWALELASGMEKFISAIAIRNALINYSNLPRPNFMAIDEGFGVLDSENMSSLYNLFQFLKTQYQFILVISHIDSLKDMAEKQIEIYKDEGFSKIYF